MELFKLFQNKLFKIGMLAATGLLFLYFWFAEVGGEISTVDGKFYSGYEAVQMNRKITEEFEGDLTDEKVNQIIEKYGLPAKLEENMPGWRDGNFLNDFVTRYFTNGASYIDRKKNKIDEIKKYLDEVVIAYDDVTDSEIKSLLEEDLNEFKLDINRLNQFCNEMLSKNDKLFEKVDNTEWKKKRIAIQNKYVSVMQNLQDNGLDTVKLDTLMEQRNNKKEEIDRILIKEKQLCKLEEEYESLESVYRNKVDIIYKLRNNFIQEVIGNDKNVKFQLAKNRNRNSFINNLKAIMQKEITSVDDDINELADLYFKKEDGIEKYKKMLISIRNKEDQKSLSKKTRDIITSIAEDSFARMIAFIPDDDLIVSYRPEKAKKFIPLSNASAGQKTTTILTFLLAYGNQPLLLDQPEDDLDNRLVYDLIVARLKVAKSKRQIIVVTHNANIPVNGDSEYIISMDSETDIIQVNQTGTMDDESIRQEICDVMEGTKDAFEMRAKKYHFNIKE